MKDLVNLFVVYILLFSWIACWAQEHHNVDILGKLLEEDRLDELAERLPEVAQQFPNSPTVLYLQGVLEKDGARAIGFFQRLLELHPDSKYADRAIMRIAQFHYVNGHYRDSINQYRFLNNNFPDSPLRDLAAYQIVQCFLAQGNVDSARVQLRRFIVVFQSSSLVNAAILDLEATEKSHDVKQNSSRVSTAPPVHKGKIYTVQIGAFQHKKNAMRLVKKAIDLGYDVEGFRKTENRKTVYVVWVGEFSTRQQAETFARTFQQKHHMNYIIVAKPD